MVRPEIRTVRRRTPGESPGEGLITGHSVDQRPRLSRLSSALRRNIKPHTNIERMIDAFGRARPGGPPGLTLVIIGDEVSKYPSLRQMVHRHKLDQPRQVSRLPAAGDSRVLLAPVGRVRLPLAVRGLRPADHRRDARSHGHRAAASSRATPAATRRSADAAHQARRIILGHRTTPSAAGWSSRTGGRRLYSCRRARCRRSRRSIVESCQTRGSSSSVTAGGSVAG